MRRLPPGARRGESSGQADPDRPAADHLEQARDALGHGRDAGHRCRRRQRHCDSNLIPVSGPRATVSTVEGALYNVANAVIAPISTGATVEEGQPIRTAKATYAVLKLADGSKVEMNERAQIAILRTWRGTTIRLDAGNIIVQAAKQKHGKLYVASGDATVAVKGTVFAVSRGLKGSRVSVIEGVVEVAHSGQTETLRKGDQTTTDANLLKTSVPEEVSWSRNSAQYYALLGEFATLQKKLEAIPGPGLRYSSKLASYLPENTAVYLAIPNIASTLAEAERLIEEQSRDSAVLREWWEKRDKNGFQKALTELKTVGQYVGDEIVIGLAANDQSQPRDPMVLAEVKRPGLKAYIETKMAEMGAGQGRLKVAANASELAATHRSEKEPVMYASDSLFVMSPDPAAVSRAVAGQGGFTKTELWNRVSKSYRIRRRLAPRGGHGTNDEERRIW